MEFSMSDREITRRNSFKAIAGLSAALVGTKYATCEFMPYPAIPTKQAIVNKLGYVITDYYLAAIEKRPEVVIPLNKIEIYQDLFLYKRSVLGFYSRIECPVSKTIKDRQTSENLAENPHISTYKVAFEFKCKNLPETGITKGPQPWEHINIAKNKVYTDKYFEICQRLTPLYKDIQTYMSNLTYKDILKIDRKVAETYFVDIERFYANLG